MANTSFSSRGSTAYPRKRGYLEQGVGSPPNLTQSLGSVDLDLTRLVKRVHVAPVVGSEFGRVNGPVLHVQLGKQGTLGLRMSKLKPS